MIEAIPARGRSTPNLNQFRKTKRRKITQDELEEALTAVFLNPEARCQEREPGSNQG